MRAPVGANSNKHQIYLTSDKRNKNTKSGLDFNQRSVEIMSEAKSNGAPDYKCLCILLLCKKCKTRQFI